MKSERRHELQHNELADWLIKAGEAVKPYQNVALALVAAVVVAVVGYKLWARQAAATVTQAWDETSGIIDSGNVPKLTKVVEDYPHTNAAQMAQLVLGDYYLAEGCNRLFINKATAQTDLNKAIGAYEAVLDQSRVSSYQERATFGLARVKEAKATKADLEQAEQLYGNIVSKWPDGAFAAAAKQRLDDLKRPETKRIYDRFAKFDPKPAFSSEPGPKPSFEMPSEAPPELPATSYDLKLGNMGADKAKATADKAKAPEDKKPTDAAGKK